jgi:hypothetical protein
LYADVGLFGGIPSPSAPSIDQPENDQKQDGADGGGDDRRHDAGAKMMPMQRSATKPNPVPLTIWPASQPAINPINKTTRRLSPDIGYAPIVTASKTVQAEKRQNYKEIGGLRRALRTHLSEHDCVEIASAWCRNTLRVTRRSSARRLLPFS